MFGRRVRNTNIIARTPTHRDHLFQNHKTVTPFADVCGASTGNKKRVCRAEAECAAYYHRFGNAGGRWLYAVESTRRPALSQLSASVSSRSG